MDRADGRARAQSTDSPSAWTSAADSDRDRRLDLNQASFEQLRDIGLSITQAKRLLLYRERHGGLVSILEIDKIPGFPRALVEEIKRRSWVDPGHGTGGSGDADRGRQSIDSARGTKAIVEQSYGDASKVRAGARPEPRERPRQAQAHQRSREDGGRGGDRPSRDRPREFQQQNIKTGRQLWVETLPKVLPYAKPYWKLLTLSMVLTLFVAAFTLAQPWPIALVFDDVFGQDQGSTGFLSGFAHSVVGDGQFAVIGFAVAALFALTVLEGTTTLLNRYVDTKLKLGMVLDFMSTLFQHFQRLGLTFHQKRSTGALMNRVNQAPQSLGEFVTAAGPILQSVVTLLGMLVVSLLIDWQVALAALAIVPLIYYQISLYSNRVLPRLRAVGKLEMNVMSITLEAMQMLRLVVGYGREQHEYRRFREQAEITNRERMKVTIRQTLFSIGVNAATAAGTALVLGLGAWHVVQGKLSVGELVVLMAYIAAVYQPLQTLTSTFNDLSEQLVMLSFATEILEEEPEIVDAPHAKSIARARGGLTFDNVSFTYKGRKRTLKDISFDVQPGQRVAIVGPTGSGKSTLASLMIRFYDPAKGTIRLDGHDIRELKQQSLREQIGIVLQEPLVFSGTIGDNIRYGRPDAPESDVVAAAKAANVHDFIAGLKDGYDTELGERGAQLSGGEQQRICVARAFLKDAPILILDEPTSSIDADTERVILDALDELMVGRTSFMISHRLSTIRGAELILVMGNGRVVAQGTHKELLKRNNLYRKLFGAEVSPKRVSRIDGRAVAAGARAADGGAQPARAQRTSAHSGGIRASQ
jgi:ATP-binding cassette subfamily B protein/subfamily B ATP-binding cassette protein MsbA